MSKFEESNFYKALQDFFINADKKTFLQFLAEFYNRTEGIIDKNNIQDDLIKELRELYLKFNENGLTSERPTTNLQCGMMFFDRTLNKPIWRNKDNNGWVDAMGTSV